MSQIYKVGITIALLFASTPGWSRSGDAARGAQVYANICSGCHALDSPRTGPAHRGVFGRKAGSAPNYAYSASLSFSQIIWNEKSLNRWLTNPQATIPGARMGMRLTDPQMRADVIAYLRGASTQ